MEPEKAIARILLEKAMSISTTESCTGGLVSSRLTDIAGSSAFIKENYVTYANEAKIKLLNVSSQTLETQGAVSEQCAKEMVEGLFAATGCDIALSTTGIAGPDGGSGEKPVGTIYIGIKSAYKTEVRRFNLNPKYNRRIMKYAFSQVALEFLLEFLNN